LTGPRFGGAVSTLISLEAAAAVVALETDITAEEDALAVGGVAGVAGSMGFWLEPPQLQAVRNRVNAIDLMERPLRFRRAARRVCS